MEKLIHLLRNRILPECFELRSNTLSFKDHEEFRSVVSHSGSFLSLVAENTSVGNTDAYVDTFESGFLGALALTLWFMEFDEDNWFSFSEVHGLIRNVFSERSRTGERLELRLVKGCYSPMMLDQPVVLDWKTGEIWFLFGKLND